MGRAIMAVCAFAVLSAAPALAEDDPLDIARSTGEMAGKAVHCGVETEAFEDFVIRASRAIEENSPDPDVTAEASERFAAAMDSAIQDDTPDEAACEEVLAAFRTAHDELRAAGF